MHTTPALPVVARRNLQRLVSAQALYVCASAIGLTLTALVGAQLAPSPALATLPLALVMVATAVSTVPVSLAMARWGRRPLLLLGAACGVAGGLLAAWAIVHGQFAVFGAANVLLGVYQAAAQYHRFAAVEAVGDGGPVWQQRAVGWVVGGGVAAAVAGPTLAAWARDALAPHLFAGAYLVVAAVALLAGALLAGLRPPAPQASALAAPARWRDALTTPGFALAVTHSAVAYAVMAFVMTATPLAVVGCGLGVGVAAGVIQWHLVAMFAPGFFTGRLMARFGVGRVMLGGTALLLAGTLAARAGQSGLHFGVALALNGLGWNFMYVGATARLAEAFAGASAALRARAQAANEFITFSLTALGMLAAGAVYTQRGWDAVNAATWPALAATVALSGWLARRR